MVSREPQRLPTRIGRFVDDRLTAEALAQESLVRALRNLGTLRGPAEEALLWPYSSCGLRDVKGLSTRDTADTLKIKEGRVKWRLPGDNP